MELTNKGRGSWLKMGTIVIVLFLLLMIPLTQQFFIPMIKKQMSLVMIKNHSLREGDVIMFGDNAWNNTWCVLKIEDRKVLLINKSCVDIRNSEGYVTNFDPHLGKSFLSFPYIPENAEIYHSENWDRSGLKKWLNDEYYNTAFSDPDKEYILDIGYGNVYILNAEEVVEYFSNDTERIAEYYGAAMPWWLRSTGRYELETYNDYVGKSGRILDNGYAYSESNIGVRPSIWIRYE